MLTVVAFSMCVLAHVGLRLSTAVVAVADCSPAIAAPPGVPRCTSRDQTGKIEESIHEIVNVCES